MNCPICFKSKKNMIIISNCSHIFCNFCIQKWYKHPNYKNRCPLCRKEFKKNELKKYIHQYEEENIIITPPRYNLRSSTLEQRKQKLYQDIIQDLDKIDSDIVINDKYYHILNKCLKMIYENKAIFYKNNILQNTLINKFIDTINPNKFKDIYLWKWKFKEAFQI
jgi:hypothetical protein